jgi:hypothetical protein
MVKNKKQSIANYLLNFERIHGEFDAYEARVRADGKYNIVGFDVYFDCFGEVKNNETIVAVKTFE